MRAASRRASGTASTRQRVLHLAEAHRARAREHLVRAVGELAVAVDLGRQPVDARGSPWRDACRRLHISCERRSTSRVVDPVADRRRRAARGARRAAGCWSSSCTVSVCGQPVELEVVGGSAARVDTRRALVERLGMLDRVQQERGHALDGDLDEHAERAEPERARRAAARRSRSRSTVEQRSPSPVTSVAPRICVASPPKRSAGAVGAGRGRAGDRLAVDVAHVLQREAVAARAAPGSWCRLVPAAERHAARSRVDARARPRGRRGRAARPRSRRSR